MNAFERLEVYARVNTVSHEDSATTPSTPWQRDLARLLAQEMQDMGMSEVFLDEPNAYVYGQIPATPGYEACKAIGFIAHLDTVDEMGDKGANPQIVSCWDGEDIALGTSGMSLKPQIFCNKDLKGKRLMTTDGTSVLGADDKAGIAVILTMCETFLQNDEPHGRICVCFTPDEEIGHGAELLDLERFGADFAYTVDGGEPNELGYETFNAAKAEWEITGCATHPGSAKDKMINASTVAMEVNAMLPADEVPEKTCDREGFYHLTGMSGTIVSAKLQYIIRDHDALKFEQRKEYMASLADRINEKYGAGTAKVTVTDQYRNMADVVLRYPELLEIAGNAIKKNGWTPESLPVRGGTDGAQLSYRGLPCPNLGTGSYGCHGPYEFAVEEYMNDVVNILIDIVRAFGSC